MLCVVPLALALTGCAAHPDPIVDMKGVDPERLEKDWDECEEYTEQILISQGIAKGSGLGAAVGAGRRPQRNGLDAGISPSCGPDPLCHRWKFF